MNPRDIGNVYKRNDVYYIAISDFALLTYKDGKFSVFTTEDKHTFVKNISVRKLCKRWKIPTKVLDDEIQKYLAPDLEAKERVRSEKIKYLDLIHSWS
jgi:hypothetical protein